MSYTIYKYLRISAEDIDLDGFDKYESNSIANQRRYLDEHISKTPAFEDCEVLEIVDDGYSGTNFLRPGVQELIEKAQNGEVQCIIVKDFSRLGRNYIEVGDFIEQKFPAWGVRFISINDHYDSSKFNGITGVIDVGFRNLVYEMYSRDLSEKVRSAKDAATRNGKCVNAVPPYGYVKDPNDRHKLVIDPPTAAVIQRVFDLVEQGLSYTQIVRMFNDENIPTPQERKRQLGYLRQKKGNEPSIWYAGIISDIVKDERYTGKWIYGKRRMIDLGHQATSDAPESEWIVIPDAVPAIVTEAQFKSVRSKLPKVSFGKFKNLATPLFSRKLRCMHCGKFMVVTRRKNYNLYKCHTPKIANTYNCVTDEWINENELAEKVMTVLKQQLALSNEAYQMLETKSEKSASGMETMKSEVLHLQKAVEKAKSAKLALWEKMQDNKISEAVFQRGFDKADGQIDKLTAKIQELTGKISTCNTESLQEQSSMERQCKLSCLQELTREAVEEFVNEIKIYSADNIEIVLNTADEYKQLVS